MQTSSGGRSTIMAQKMGIWLLMLTIALLFGTLSLAFMLTGDKPVDFSVPWGFYLNTVILLASSVLLHLGWVKRKQQSQGILLRPAVILGVAFLLSQAFAWFQLYTHGLDLAHSGRKVSYLYLLTGLHAAHLLGGILFLVYVWVKYDGNGRKYLESAVYFWHFLGILWIYLLCVLMVNA